jgi:cholesterol transport system auxiliary component
MSGSTGRVCRVAVVGLAVGLAGCSALSGTAPLDTYDFTTPSVPAAVRPAGPQVLVADPIADRALDSERMMVRSSTNGVANYAGAQWADRLPRLVQARLVAVLEASGRVRAAVRPGQGVAADRQVLVDIRRFEYRPAEQRVLIELAVKAMDDRSGRIVAGAVLDGEEPVVSDDARTVAAAFDAALGRVLVAAVPVVTR